MSCRAIIEIDEIGTTTISEAEINHLTRVRRVREGAEFLGLSLKEGTWYQCRLVRGNKHWEVERLSTQPESRESPLHIQLACALLKKDKMEWVIQKACELGVTAIAPLVSDHVEPAVSRRFQKNQSRLKKIALESVKQCGRTKVLRLHPLAQLSDFISRHRENQIIVLDETGGNCLETCLQDLKRQHSDVTLLVGPEGGWSPRDRRNFQVSSVTRANLGTRIIRAETASVAGVVILQYMYGDLRP
jgi:16S rRNA (uracil1498-N3)-methyltransferase